MQVVAKGTLGCSAVVSKRSVRNPMGKLGQEKKNDLSLGPAANLQLCFTYRPSVCAGENGERCLCRIAARGFGHRLRPMAGQGSEASIHRESDDTAVAMLLVLLCGA